MVVSANHINFSSNWRSVGFGKRIGAGAFRLSTTITPALKVQCDLNISRKTQVLVVDLGFLRNRLL